MFRSKALAVFNGIIAVIGAVVTLLSVSVVMSAPRPNMTPADYGQWAQLKFLNALPELLIATVAFFVFNLLCWMKKSGETEFLRAWEWALRPAFGWTLMLFLFWNASAALGAYSLYRSQPAYRDISQEFFP